jgi:hypothetical protein
VDSYEKDLAKRLYDRRYLAAPVPYEDHSSADFQPIAKECHVNVDKWCLLHPNHKPIRGWLIIEMPALRRVHFVAHSVVEDETGRRFDVTPQVFLDKRSFLEDEDPDEVYMLRNVKRNLVSLDHYL